MLNIYYVQEIHVLLGYCLDIGEYVFVSWNVEGRELVDSPMRDNIHQFKTLEYGCSMFII